MSRSLAFRDFRRILRLALPLAGEEEESAAPTRHDAFRPNLKMVWALFAREVKPSAIHHAACDLAAPESAQD